MDTHEVTVTTFNPDAHLLAVLWPLYVIVAALVAGLALRRFIGRWLLEGDPRRQLIAQVILYVGAFMAIAVSTCGRHR